MKYSFIQLRFLKPEQPKEEDYVINIKRNGDEFLWFTQDELKSRVQVMWLEEDELWKQLELMIQLLTWDADPYCSVQVILPALPSVLIRMQDIDKAFGDIKRLMQLVIDNWPENMPLQEARQLDSDDVYEDEDYEDEEESDDESDSDSSSSSSSDESGYTDMPGLEPQDTTVWYSNPNFRNDTLERIERILNWGGEEQCGNCPCTPQRPKKDAICPNAPERKLKNEVVGDADDAPARNTRSKSVPRVYRTIERLDNGKERVHTYFS